MDASTPRPLAVITGASSGIGLELAKQFAAARHDLVVCAEDMTELVRRVLPDGVKAKAHAKLAEPGSGS